MTVDIARQIHGLCRAILMGGALGVLYDLMRVVRRRVPLPLLVGILDFLFWVTATVALFLFSHAVWDGQIRFYGAAFCLLGGTAYFWGISPLVMGIFLFLATLADRLLGILTAPARALGRIFKKIKKFAKASFLSRKKRV